MARWKKTLDLSDWWEGLPLDKYYHSGMRGGSRRCTPVYFYASQGIDPREVVAGRMAYNFDIAYGIPVFDVMTELENFEHTYEVREELY